MKNPFTMTPDDLERIGLLVDRLDNASYAALLPLPADLHVEGMKGVIEDVRDELKAFLKERFFFDPWTSMIDDEE